jgi:sugar phosphate isomerase/epimerase
MNEPMPQSTLGVQLYTVRALLDADPSRTLRALAEIGYRDIELLEHHLDVIVPLARDAGLTPVSVHVEALSADGDIERRFDAIRAHGLTHVALAWLLPHERGVDLAFWQRFAAWMNVVGERAARAGLTFAYHNHAFEFRGIDDGARSAFDVLVEMFDPRFVGFELDVFWASMAGVDPASLLERLSGRVPLLHLKDRDPRVSGEMDEQKVPHSAFVEAGSGALNIPGILDAAAASGVRHVFVEQDYTPGNPLDSLRQSFQYVSALRQPAERDVSGK